MTDPALPAEADEADALEQRTDLVDESGAAAAGVLSDEADPEADAVDIAEQDADAVPPGDEDYPAADEPGGTDG